MEPTTITTPTLRVRVSHTHTQRGGWKHETTVEIGAALPTEPEAVHAFRGEVRYWLRQADELGREESAERNRLDGGDEG